MAHTRLAQTILQRASAFNSSPVEAQKRDS
jgi:hypothetical protein